MPEVVKVATLADTTPIHHFPVNTTHADAVLVCVWLQIERRVAEYTLSSDEFEIFLAAVAVCFISSTLRMVNLEKIRWIIFFFFPKKKKII